MHARSPGTLSTGIQGLDDVLCGGLPAGHLYLLEGQPGTGKTTMALQFLLEGRARGERGFYVTLSETIDELIEVAASHGWTLDDIDVYDLVSDEDLGADAEQSILHPSEYELGETVREVMRIVEEKKPIRVVFDSLSELRLLSQGPLRYRRQILALKRFFRQLRCTVLMLDDNAEGIDGSNHLHSIAHGVIHLSQNAHDYGPDKRQLRVMKLRGLKFRSGEHDFDLDRGGLQVFPRLVASEHSTTVDERLLSTGTPELDSLLGGGLSPGSSLLLAGPAGVGKTTTAISCAVAAMKRGAKVAYYLFDEGLGTLIRRSSKLGLGIEAFRASGHLNLRALDPAEVSPGAFAHAVRESVETDGVEMVVIDSLNAYLQAMPGGKFLLLQMHELLAYLNGRGVVTMLILSQHGVIGEARTDVDLSYLSDSMLQFRFFEARGNLHKAVSAVKSRTRSHEGFIREFRIGPRGIEVGQALSDFEGILAGVARYGGSRPMLGDNPIVTSPGE